MMLDRVSGKPRRSAIDAASEKFNKETTVMMVEIRHRLNELRRERIGRALGEDAAQAPIVPAIKIPIIPTKTPDCRLFRM